jgi:DNA-binding transcriptional regulator YiaG
MKQTDNKSKKSKRKLRPKTLIFKSKVKEYREKHGFSVDEFAALLNVNRHTLYGWECGIFPREATRAHMLEVLGCTFDDLFYEVNL